MNNSGLDINMLEAYLKGTLDAKSMHRIEKAALEDPFIAEALEGLSHSAAYAQNLSLLQKQLHDRVAEQKVVKKANVITWQRLSIAATAAVVFISVGIMFLMRESNTTNQKIAGNTKKAVELSVSPSEPDSVPVPLELSSSEQQIAAAKVVAVAPAKKAVVPEKVEQEIALAVSDITPSEALAKNAVKPRASEEIILGTLKEKTEQAEQSATVATVLQSRVSDINIPMPAARGKFVSPKDGTTPVQDPVEKPVLGNRPETLAYVQNTKASPSHSLTAALRENSNTLNEIVVSGYNTVKPAKSAPVPSVDHAAYAKYLTSNNKWFNTGAAGEFVELGFEVSKSGKPEEIKVLKGLAQKYNEEAIRLLTEGPKWIVPKKGSNKTTLKVYF